LLAALRSVEDRLDLFDRDELPGSATWRTPVVRRYVIACCGGNVARPCQRRFITRTPCAAQSNIPRTRCSGPELPCGHVGRVDFGFVSHTCGACEAHVRFLCNCLGGSPRLGSRACSRRVERRAVTRSLRPRRSSSSEQSSSADSTSCTLPPTAASAHRPPSSQHWVTAEIEPIRQQLTQRRI